MNIFKNKTISLLIICSFILTGGGLSSLVYAGTLRPPIGAAERVKQALEEAGNSPSAIDFARQAMDSKERLPYNSVR